MYTVVEIKGHQYKVKAGDLIDVEKIEAEVGTTVDFDKVLMVGGATISVGAPTVGGASVTAKVVKQGRTRKILILKRKPGGSRRKNGHRQCYTALLITGINDGKGGVTKADVKTKTEVKAKPAAAAPAPKKEKTAKTTTAKTAKPAKTTKAAK